MPETIVIRPNSSRKHPLDYGQMIENLFFYRNTIAHIGRNEIRSLFDLADVDVLERLLSLQDLSVYYNNSHTGVTDTNGIRTVDSFGLANLDLEKELYEESFQHRKDKLRSRKFAKKISRKLKVYELPNNFNKVLIENLRDEQFRKKVLIATVKNYHPNHSWDLESSHYDLEFLDDTRFKIRTDINFDETNLVGLDSPILALVNAVEDLQVMSEFSSEISVPEFNSEIIRMKLNATLESINPQQKGIEVFNHFDLEESWALREAINNKQIHVKAVLNLFDKAQKHRWIIKELPPDIELTLEYIEELRRSTLFDRLPFKAVRFYLFNGAGFILSQLNPEVGIPATIGLNAFDTFLLDKLINKWTPNQFIEGELRPLLVNKNQ